MTTEEWLLQNKKFLSIRGLEAELNCPDSLQKVVQGKRKLSKPLDEKLRKFIAENLNLKKVSENLDN